MAVVNQNSSCAGLLRIVMYIIESSRSEVLGHRFVISMASIHCQAIYQIHVTRQLWYQRDGCAFCLVGVAATGALWHHRTDGPVRFACRIRRDRICGFLSEQRASRVADRPKGLSYRIS